VKGYQGTILEVNISTGAIKRSNVDKQALREFIGGSGLAAKLFFDRVSPDVDPLSGDNILFLVTGPLTGTNLPGTPRFTACYKSPLTGIWGEANCGGNFGVEMRFAGYDGIAIEGASDKPVYLLIDDERVEIKDASDLWGRDTYEVTDILKERIGGGRKVKVLAVGQAGENTVKYASIMNDKGSALGRTGGGAVMGAKKLKAIAVRGTGKVEPAEVEEFGRRRREILEKVKASSVTKSMKTYGTGAVIDLMKVGDLPIKNWSLGEVPGLDVKLDKTTLRDNYVVRMTACHGCPVSCKKVVRIEEGPYRVEEGPGPEYETIASFGSMLMIDDLAWISKINEVCNRYGIDTISCGSTLAFAMDCFEHGLINESDTGGIRLRWGDKDAVSKMVEKIACRDGFGDVLAEGSREAARRIGDNARDYAAEVKGLEAPMHDPRALHGLGLAYATSVTGACHNKHRVISVEMNGVTYPEVGLTGGYVPQTSEGKAKMVMLCENLGMVVNSAIVCSFVMGSLDIADLVDMLRLTTGFDYDSREMMECGERIWLLKRGLCNLMGVRAGDDRLPRKMMTPVKEGGAAGSVPDIELMLREYYRLRPLDAEGRPEKEKLRSIGLADLAARL